MRNFLISFYILCIDSFVEIQQEKNTIKSNKSHFGREFFFVSWNNVPKNSVEGKNVKEFFFLLFYNRVFCIWCELKFFWKGVNQRYFCKNFAPFRNEIIIVVNFSRIGVGHMLGHIKIEITGNQTRLY